MQARFLTAQAGLLTRFLTAQAGLLTHFLTAQAGLLTQFLTMCSFKSGRPVYNLVEQLTNRSTVNNQAVTFYCQLAEYVSTSYFYIQLILPALPFIQKS